MVEISLQSAFEVLASPDLLAAILSCLDELRDLLSCSAVSKAWNAATQKLQLGSLVIPGTCEDIESVDIDGLPSTILWLQEKHIQGAFAGIKILTVCLEHAYTGACHDTELLQSHLRSILSIAGTWGTLQSCSLRGDFPWDLPASLLPKNIQQLSMDLDMEPDQNVGMKKPLSLFNRFLNLQSLKIAPIDDINDQDELDLEQYVLSSTFPQLTSLSLLDVPMHVSPSCTLATCLPVLTDLQVCVYPRKAQAVLDLKTLKFLCLTLLYKPGLDNYADLIVCKDSKLQKLRIKGSHESLVTVTVEKVDLMFCCSLITVKHRWLETLRDEAIHFG